MHRSSISLLRHLNLGYSNVGSALSPISSKYGGLRLMGRSSSRFHQGRTVSFSDCNWVAHIRDSGGGSVMRSMFTGGIKSP